MMPPVPILEEYGISPNYGFLPAELPLEILPDPYYKRWEAIVANLQALILSKSHQETAYTLHIQPTDSGRMAEGIHAAGIHDTCLYLGRRSTGRGTEYNAIWI